MDVGRIDAENKLLEDLKNARCVEVDAPREYPSENVVAQVAYRFEGASNRSFGVYAFTMSSDDASSGIFNIHFDFALEEREVSFTRKFDVSKKIDEQFNTGRPGDAPFVVFLVAIKESQEKNLDKIPMNEEIQRFILMIVASAFTDVIDEDARKIMEEYKEKIVDPFADDMLQLKEKSGVSKNKQDPMFG